MIGNVFDRANTFAHGWVRTFGKTGQAVSIQSNSSGHLSEIESVDTLKQHTDRDILMSQCLVKTS